MQQNQMLAAANREIRMLRAHLQEINVTREILNAVVSGLTANPAIFEGIAAKLGTEFNPEKYADEVAALSLYTTNVILTKVEGQMDKAVKEEPIA